MFSEEIKQENDSSAGEGENEIQTNPKAFSMKLTKSRPDKTIRRKQLKAKSKAISDQIKKRKKVIKKKVLKKWF